MPPQAPTPSARLLRAAAAERDELRRHRERLAAARQSLREELARIEDSLAELDERDALLGRLVGSTESDALELQARPDAPLSSVEALRGPAIRRAAVEVLLRHPDRPQALHYRDWFALLGEAGYEVAGKDPLAVFLTQLTRSPAVHKSTQAGVYELDRTAEQRLRRELDELHGELRGLASTPTDPTDLSDLRARRAQLAAHISQTEKALEEVAGLFGARDRDTRLAAVG